MADDQFTPIVDAGLALKSVTASIEMRRGYTALIQKLVAPFPVAFEHDQTKRNQMITLLGRADSLATLVLVYAESKYAGRKAAGEARRRREERLGPYLTRAAIARAMALSETGKADAAVERRHTVASGRIVEAGLSYGLFELGDPPDAKRQPIEGTLRLASFVHALGDHIYWTMVEAVGTDTSDPDATPALREEFKSFQKGNKANRVNRIDRITAADNYLKLFI